MLIKSDSLKPPKYVRNHDFPRDEPPAGSAEVAHAEEAVITVEECLQTIAALEQELERVSEARYQEGMQSGEQVGYARGIETIQTDIKKFAEGMESIRAQQEAVLASSEKFVVDFALKIVEKIVGSEQFLELPIKRSKLEKVVEEASNLFADSTKYIIRVHKNTAELLEHHKSEILEQMFRPVALSIVDDPSLRPQDCLIESDHGVLDARIDSQLKEIKSIFKGK